MVWLIIILIIVFALAYLYNKGKKAFEREAREEAEKKAAFKRLEHQKKRAKQLRQNEIQKYTDDFLKIIWSLQSSMGEGGRNGLIQYFKNFDLSKNLSSTETYFYQTIQRMLEIEENDDMSLSFPAYGNHFNWLFYLVGRNCKRYSYDSDGKITTSPKKKPTQDKVEEIKINHIEFKIEDLFKKEAIRNQEKPTLIEGLINACEVYEKQVAKAQEIRKEIERQKEEQERLKHIQWKEEFKRKRDNKIYQKGDSEYVSNGVYEIGVVRYMSIWSYKNKHNIEPNTNEDNSYDSNELRAEGVKSYNSKPDFGGFDTVYIFPVHALDKFYGY